MRIDLYIAKRWLDKTAKEPARSPGSTTSWDSIKASRFSPEETRGIQRVALQWASQREAGLVKVPPKFLAKVEEELARIYGAYHVAAIEHLYQTRYQKMSPDHDPEKAKALTEYVNKVQPKVLMEQVKDGIKDLKVGREFILRVRGPEKLGTLIRIKFDKESETFSGWDDRTRRMYHRREIKAEWSYGVANSRKPKLDSPSSLEYVLRWLENDLLNRWKGLRGRVKPMSAMPKDYSLIDWKIVEQMARQDARGLRLDVKKPDKKGKWPEQMFSARIPVDYTGWEYAPQGGDIEPKVVTLEVMMGAAPKGFGGFWRESQSVIAVNIPNPTNNLLFGGQYRLEPKAYKKRLDKHLKTVRHEVVHMTQDAIKNFKGLDEEGGLPGRSVKTPGFTPSGYPTESTGRGQEWKGQPRSKDKGYELYIEHRLRDVEFYTRLRDEVELFLKKVGTLAPFKQEAAFRDAVEKSYFFLGLKKHQPEKWKKAVKVFTTEVRKKWDPPVLDASTQRVVDVFKKVPQLKTFDISRYTTMGHDRMKFYNDYWTKISDAYPGIEEMDARRLLSNVWAHKMGQLSAKGKSKVDMKLEEVREVKKAKRMNESIKRYMEKKDIPYSVYRDIVMFYGNSLDGLRATLRDFTGDFEMGANNVRKWVRMRAEKAVDKKLIPTMPEAMDAFDAIVNIAIRHGLHRQGPASEAYARENFRG